MRVLVVEDVPRHANRIAEGLRDQGIAVDVAYDGQEAASKLNVNPYDVVILDRDLPGIHGDQLCQIITHSKDPAMVLMLTAAGGIEFDPTTGAVTRDGQTIELTAKERAVLEALLKATPAALSAERLLEQAWDENVDPFTNTVKVTIARLRRKLGQPDIIHTTPGIGYSITAAP